MNDEQFKELKNKLDVIIRLLSLNLVKDMNFQKDKIVTLSSFGFEPSQIAELLGTTANTVRVALSVARKKTRTKTATKGARAEKEG